MDPETVLWIDTILTAVLLGLNIYNTRRIHRMTDKIDELTALVTELQAELADATAKEATFQTQQTATSASLVAAVARIEAIINSLQNNNDPRLDAAINSLAALKTDLGTLGAGIDASTVAEKAEQDQLDAERPDAPPPA